jgi:hypothetical protein
MVEVTVPTIVVTVVVLLVLLAIVYVVLQSEGEALELLVELID